MLTPGAPFDRYLQGDVHAISDLAKRGYREFKSIGCVACHQGAAVGGNMFQRLGVMRQAASNQDLGRYQHTGRPRDKFVFKVPSLRNVARTAPYFLDGSAATLREAIRVMADAQLGRKLTPGQTDSLVAFLESLTAELPK